MTTTSNHNHNHHDHDPGQQTQHSPPPLYSDAPEVAQSHYSPEPVASPAGGPVYSPDYDGEKVFVSAGYGGSAGAAAVNTDPASSPQAVLGSESSPRSSPTEVNRDPKSFPQALGLSGVGSGDSAHSPRSVEDGAAAKRPWWRRKKVIAIIAAVALIVLALVIGLAVGLTQRGGGNGDDENSSGGNGDGGSGGRQGSPR